MSDADDPEIPESEVPEGAAVFPLIPAELGVNPFLLAVLHATVFLAGSDDEVVDGEAAQESLEYLAGYLQRLEGDALTRTREDMTCLVSYARQEKWPKQLIQSLKSFLDDFGVGRTDEA
jgi:hypothetical protein